MKLKLHNSFLLLLSVCSLSTYANTSGLEKSESGILSSFKKLEFETYLSASARESKYLNAEYVNFELSMIGEQEVTNRFTLMFDARAKSRKSSLTFVEKVHGENLKSKSDIEAKEAKLRYLSQDETILFEGGLINQKIQNNKLVVGRDAHLGLREGIAFKTDIGTFEVSASQTRPQVSTFSENNENVDTQKATFFNENVRFKPETPSHYSFDMTLGHHAYNNLGPSVAYDSLFRGNTVYGSSERNANFAYSFNGWNYALNAKYLFSKSYELELFYFGILNTQAPTGKNMGNVGGFVATYKNAVHEYAIEVARGVVDSDATPGSFMAYADYKTNNTTNKIWLKYDNTRENLSFKLLLQESSVNNPIEFVQADESVIQFQMSKTYEIF